MRITVNLSLYFGDHRSLAKIFIKDMNTVKDLEDHISSIFQIKHFNLMLENDYLPSSEPIQILEYDEVVWAVPIEEKNDLNSLKKKKKDKSKRALEEDEIVEVASCSKKIKNKVSLPEENCLSKGKKYKCKDSQSELNGSLDLQIPIPKKKKDKSRDSLPQTEENAALDIKKTKDKFKKSLPEKNSTLETDAGFASGKDPSPNGKVKSLVLELERKKQDLIIRQDSPRVNIVKTIVVSNKCEDSNLQSELAETSSISSFGSNIAKRKRKRVRKRKPAEKQRNAETTNEPETFVLKQKAAVPSPSHIRFNGDKSEEEVNAETKTEEQVQSSEVDVNYSKEQIESSLAKQTITKSVAPKIGDVIAFKMLKISDNYTPEVSSFVVGKVKSYSSQTNNIKFDILYGREEFTEPQGKFSLTSNEEEDDKKEEPDNEEHLEFQCVWDSVLEPRLIFP